MPCVIVNKREIPLPGGVRGLSYHESSEPRFKHKERKDRITNIVLHETAGRTATGCKQTLIQKGYGAQVILDRDGFCTFHGDLALDQMAHANQLNSCSIGIEIVNPYAPQICSAALKYSYMPATWWTWCPDKNDRRYVLPTADQLDCLEILVMWLCRVLDVLYEFPTIQLSAKMPRIKRWFLGAKPGPGIVAHRDFASHSDGRYPLEYLFLNNR